jgi:hypothetical protein
MRETFNIPPRVRLLAWILIAAGVLALAAGFISGYPGIWSAVLLNNFYFLSLSLGALFFISVQNVTDSGWSAMFMRVPEAMAAYLPAAFLVMLLLLAGIAEIYEWAVPGITETDSLIAHKTPWLNIPFFYVRVLVLFGIWFLLYRLMRRVSLRLDKKDNQLFGKFRHYSMVFIFVFALTFTIAAFDWIMSIDSHWFSTLFGIRAIISALYYGVATVILITLWLNRSGYLESLNNYHLNDFSRYLFRLSIVWGYLWFMQYLIIWYANIPETTFYYVYRVNEPWQILFWAELIINWTIPFLILMSDDIARRRIVLVPVSLLLLAGFYLSLYLQIMPGSTGQFNIGYVEIGSFAGFAGVFILLFMRSFSGAPVIQSGNPYLQESISHHL